LQKIDILTIKAMLLGTKVSFLGTWLPTESGIYPIPSFI